MSNIALILSSGKGLRFGSKMPKQYNLINGKQVISYVIQAAKQAKTIDEIVVVANEPYLDLIEKEYKVKVVEGGAERNLSLQNGIDFCETLNCEKIIVLDAVRPFVTNKIIDDYIERLSQYSAVVTAQKITDSLGDLKFDILNRSDYYLMQSPEAFDFKLLRDNFDKNSTVTEVTQHLPKGTKIYLNFDFINNLKITYPYDIKYAAVLEREIYISHYIQRLHDYIASNYSSEAEEWVQGLNDTINVLIGKWNLTNIKFLANPHFGVIIFAEMSEKSVALKIIPPFINRYFTEKQCYKSLPKSYMCKLYGYDDVHCALLLEYINAKRDVDFYKDEALIKEFFVSVYNNRATINSEEYKEYKDYKEILDNKIKEISNNTHKKEIVKDFVAKAIAIYETMSSSDKLYLLHGDMHKYNLLIKNKKIKAIDPIGYIAPIEIEFARYIGTELTDMLMDIEENQYITVLQQNELKYEKLISFFGEINNNIDRIRKATFVDIVFRMHNSLFENTDTILTNKWLAILKVFF